MTGAAPQPDDDFQMADVTVRDCLPAELVAFCELNLAWIRRYFTVEPKDRALLDNAQAGILDKGGIILVAVWSPPDERAPAIIGTCALLRDAEPGVLQLAKMAVDERFQGRRIGQLVGQAAVERARRDGMRAVRLETNSRLTPAIRLYEKLGFVHQPARKSAYTRADVQMRLDFDAPGQVPPTGPGTKP